MEWCVTVPIVFGAFGLLAWVQEQIKEAWTDE